MCINLVSILVYHRFPSLSLLNFLNFWKIPNLPKKRQPREGTALRMGIRWGQETGAWGSVVSGVVGSVLGDGVGSGFGSGVGSGMLGVVGRGSVVPQLGQYRLSPVVCQLWPVAEMILRIT